MQKENDESNDEIRFHELIIVCFNFFQKEIELLGREKREIFLDKKTIRRYARVSFKER